MATKGVLRRSLDTPERQGAIVGETCKERGRSAIGASFPAHTLRQQDTTYMSSGGGHEPPPPLGDPQAGANRRPCCPGRAQTAAAVGRPRSEHCSLPLPSGEHAWAASSRQSLPLLPQWCAGCHYRCETQEQVQGFFNIRKSV